MKNRLFATFVVLVAVFAIVACSDGGGSTPTPGGGLKITFIAYEGADPVVIELEESQSFTDAGIELPAGATQAGLKWGGWVDSAGTAVTEDTSFIANQTIVGKWHDDTPVTADDAFEKLMLENGSYAIYGFDTSAIAISDITGVQVSYKVNEATFYSQVRNLRLMGPYIYNDYVSNVDTTGSADGKPIPHYGDFAWDENGAPTARYIAGGGAGDFYRDKNAPYINSNFNGANWAGDFEAAFGAGVARINEWFTITYAFDHDLFATGDANGAVVPRVGGAGTQVAKDGDNVYFGIGATSGGANDGGRVQLVKDIKLKTKSGDIAAFIPDFDGDGTGDQAFASYFDPIQFNWRGAPDATVTRPTPSASANPKAYLNLNTKTEIEDYDSGTGRGFFFANLANWQTVSTSEGGINATPVTGTFTGTATKGPLTVNFTENGQRLIIGLLPTQIAKLWEASGDIVITIDGTTTATTNGRYHLGDPSLGGGWNATSGSTDKPFNELFGAANATTQSFSANKDPEKKNVLNYLILQNRTDSSVAVTINSIKVEYTITPETPATPATEDLVVYSDPPVKSALITGAWATLDALNTAAGTVTFPDGLTIRSYSKFDIVVKFYKADGTTELTPGPTDQWGQVSFAAGGAAVDNYGLGVDSGALPDGTINAPTSRAKYDTIKDAGALTLNFQGRGQSTTDEVGEGAGYYIELQSVTFYK